MFFILFFNTVSVAFDCTVVEFITFIAVQQIIGKLLCNVRLNVLTEYEILGFC